MKLFRKLLFPFSILYGLMTWVRNTLYDSGWKKSTEFNLPIICVGNLNTGGTGKSPMIEYLLNFFGKEYRVASLSRGYKRKTKGYYLLEGNETAEAVGDEPLQFKRKFPEALVAVDANRIRGVEKLLSKKPEVILLDDAFQHRKIKPGFSILLTAYGDLYSDDFMLPAGNLREFSSGASRAQIIVVTKCPKNLTPPEKDRIRHRLELRNYQKLFFSYIDYNSRLVSKEVSLDLNALKIKEFCVVTGIAKPEPLLQFLQEQQLDFKHLNFGDHHNFNEEEVKKLNKENFILTTEKDYVRLQDKISASKLYYLPIRSAFLGKEEKFQQELLEFVKSYK